MMNRLRNIANAFFLLVALFFLGYGLWNMVQVQRLQHDPSDSALES